MKVLIDIPEREYKVICENNYVAVCACPNLLSNAIKNGTPILDNDCNNCEKAWTDKCERAECYENDYKYWTPYQKGNKE